MTEAQKSCFVIMPYGGQSEDLQRHFYGVFHSIIVPAARQCNYAVKRSDFSGEPGNITQAIVRDLLEADLVIADLTEANANVFFELGVRHAFRKSGTVHIVDEKHVIPFDLHQYRAIKYTKNLAELPACIEEIIKAIKLRESQPTKSDNPVHDAIVTLPIDIRTTGDAALKGRIDDLQRANEALTLELEGRKKQLDRFDPTGLLTETKPLDTDEILDEADREYLEGSEHVLLRLNNAAETGGVDAFKKELRLALHNQSLSDNDFVGMSTMCRRLNLEQHSLAVLEVGRTRYPADEDLLMYTASGYLASRRQDAKSKARVMIEQYLGVEYVGGVPVVRGSLKAKANRAIPLLCDVYIDIAKPEWAYSFTTSVERITRSTLVLRNKARAAGLLGHTEEAEATFKEAIEQFPPDDTAHAMYGHFLDDLGRYKDAYLEFERALVLDPNDAARWLGLVIQLLNHGFCRTSSAMIGPVPQKKRLEYTVPLMKRVIELDGSRRSAVVGILVRKRALKEANAFSHSTELAEGYDEDVLNWLDQLSADLISEGIIGES